MSDTGFTTESIPAGDGRTLPFRKLGTGPGMVILHGAMESAGSHMRLARALSDAFTVYLPERRGHTLGVPFDQAYGMSQEVADLASLVTATGARNVFGVSAGGLVALYGALGITALRRAAAYEPALVVDGSLRAGLLERCDREIERGDLAAALVTGMRAARLGPPVMALMPRRMLESFTAKAMEKEDAAAKDGEMTFRKLAPSLHYDFRLLSEACGEPRRLRDIAKEVLLLGGDRSPRYLQSALDHLERTIPGARRVVLPGLDHGGSSDPSPANPRGGSPELVAQALRGFFL